MLSLLLNYKLDSVSGLVPTCGRELFMPQLLRIWLTQNYDLLNRELIIIDDSDNFYANQIKWNKLPGLITFYYSSKKLDLGYKRNLLNIIKLLKNLIQIFNLFNFFEIQLFLLSLLFKVFCQRNQPGY